MVTDVMNDGTNSQCGISSVRRAILSTESVPEAAGHVPRVRAFNNGHRWPVEPRLGLAVDLAVIRRSRPCVGLADR